MNKLRAIRLLACAALLTSLHAQQVPGATALPDHPYSIKKTWIIGGVGNWDYLTMDPVALQLFIAHGPVVQVVDVETGAVIGQVAGLRQAHDIALDDTGEFGYVSDGPAGQVKVFDRRSLQVVASIPTGPSPRALVFDPQNRLLFAICTTAAAGAFPQNKNQQPNRDSEIKTSVTVIDTQTRQPLGQILMPGQLGFAQTDGNGQVFIIIVNRNQIVHLDAGAIATLLRNPTAPSSSVPPRQPATPQILDWSRESRMPSSAQNRVNIFTLGPDCPQSSGLAVDHDHQRLFAACNNMKMVVLNASSGQFVASLPTGPGTDAIAYDPNHSLIYTANGGAQGSLTVIRQDVTDTYAVIQDLPTRQRARTLAVNPATGEVYLVTDLLGVNLARPGGIGSLQPAPVNGSFQVLVIGN
jgi:DNA-binding beta-propeller fold protein YncE